MNKLAKKVIVTSSMALLVLGTITGCQKGKDAEDDKMAGTIGNRAESYHGYLGYGYNVLEAPYYNDDNVNTNAPIFDTDKLVENSLIYSAKKSKSESFVIAEASLSEYASAIGTKAGVDYWSGYQLNNDSSASITSLGSNQALLSLFCTEKRKREYIANADAEVLKDYVTSTFKKDIDKLSAEKFVKKYGTVVLTDIYMGGRLEMDFLYTGTDKTDISTLGSSLRTCWDYESSETNEAEGMAEIDKNSKMTATVYGGGVSLPTNDRKEMLKKYSEWSESLKDDNLAFVASGSTMDMVELVEQFSKDKATLITQYIDKKMQDMIDAQAKANEDNKDKKDNAEDTKAPESTDKPESDK